MGGGVGGSRHSTPAAKYNKIMMSSVGEWQVGTVLIDGIIIVEILENLI